MSGTGSEHVEVKQSKIDGAGRGLFALKDFAPGDAVLSVARPLVAELNVERMLDSCAWCFQRGATGAMERAQAASMGLPNGFIEVKACTGCRRVSYCSRTCQSKAWKREHKYECKILAPTERPELPPGVRAVIKLLGRLKAEPKDKIAKILDVLQFKPFAGDPGLEKISNQDKKTFDDYQMLAYGAWKYAGEPKLDNLDSQIAARALLFNVLCNNLGLGSPLNDAAFGNGFDPLVCSANHSCDPNVVYIFNQPAVILRALKPIKKGEEIFMRYTDVTNPFSVRQTDLMSNYFFSCQCPKCKKGAVYAEDAFEKSPDQLSAEYCKKADSLIARHEAQLSRFFVPMIDETAQRRVAALQAEAFAVSTRDEESVDEVQEALKMCINSGLWKWTRQPVPQLCRQLFGLYIASGDPYRAFRVGIKMHFEITPELSPQEFDPDRLINTWALSTVTNVLCGPMHEEIYKQLQQHGIDLRVVYLGFLTYVHEHMPKMYGWESPFGMVVENTYNQIMAGINLHEDEIKDNVKNVWIPLETLARSMGVDSL